MGTIENKDTIRRIYQALQTGDRSVFSASVHPDYVWRFPGHSSWSKRFSGQEEVRTKLLQPLFALFATEYRAHAICFVFRFRDDKIAEVVEYCDTDLEERVLGHYDDAVRQLAAS